MLVLALWGDRAPGRVATGVAAGIGQFALALWWVNEFQPVGYLVLVVLSAGFVGAAAGLTPARRLATLLPGLPAAVTLADAARDRFPLGGLPLGGISLGQTGSPLVATARWGGSLAVTGTTVAAGAVLAGGAVLLWAALRPALTKARPNDYRSARPNARPKPRPNPRPTAPFTDSAPPAIAATTPANLAAWAAAVILLVGAVAAGWLAPAGGRALRTIDVALVQGGGRRGTRAVYSNPNTVFARHQAESAAVQPPVELVVWPEAMLQTSVDYRRTNGAATLAALARRLHATVVAGVEQDHGPAQYTNQVVAWGPNGAIAGSYQKNHLVPFGEYVPARALLEDFFNLHLVPRDAIAGHGPGILRTPAAPLGVMVSFEVFFDERARGAVAAGGELLVVPTDTASYADTQVPSEELAAAELRAWETGRTVVQVTPTGYSAVIGPEGQVRARSALDAAAVVEAPVALRSGQTVYVLLGDTPLVAAAAAVLAGAGIAARRRRDRRQAATTQDNAVK